jgi:hypothetical protein
MTSKWDHANSGRKTTLHTSELPDKILKSF